MFETCRVCGCSDLRACAGGCSWVREDLCSRCARPAALLGCSNRKLNTQSPTRPEDLYQGSLFRVQLAYVRRVLHLPDSQVFILSAKYGLVEMSQFLLPYDLSLAALSPAERRAWGVRAVDALLAKVPGVADVVLLHGVMYRTAVMPHLEFHDIDVFTPHPEGLGIGRQLAWYRAQVEAACPVY